MEAPGILWSIRYSVYVMWLKFVVRSRATLSMKLFVSLFLVLCILPIGFGIHVKVPFEEGVVPFDQSPGLGDSTVAKAYLVLENKCNVCHRKRYKKQIFTLENMNASAKTIYEQVFVLRKMPKGKKNKLDQTEYQDLLNWIESTE